MGVFLGREDRTGQVLVGTRERVLRSAKFLRLPEEEQFSAEVLEAIGGPPWDAEGRRTAGVDDEEEGGALPLSAGGGEDREETAAGGGTRFYITRRHVAQFGPTPQCPGCRSAISKEGSRHHTEECRERLQGAIVADLEQRIAEAEACDTAEEAAGEGLAQEEFAEDAEKEAQPKQGPATLSG